MTGAGAGLSYAHGGWQGFATYSAMMLGAHIVSKIGTKPAIGGPGPGEDKALMDVISENLDPDQVFPENAMLDGLTDGIHLSLKDLLPDPNIHLSGVSTPNFMEQYFGPETWLKWGGAGSVVGGAYGFAAGVGISAFGSGGTLLVPAGYGGMIVGSVTGFKIGFLGARSIFGVYDWINSGARPDEFTKAWP